MSTGVRYYCWFIECDRCKVQIETGEYNIRKAQRMAEQKGWGIFGSDDLCPSCREEIE